jgi:hypothetical protein
MHPNRASGRSGNFGCYSGIELERKKDDLQHNTNKRKTEQDPSGQ